MCIRDRKNPLWICWQRQRSTQTGITGSAVSYTHLQEAVQIIRVAYDGIEIAMKVGSGGIAAMQKAIAVSYTHLDVYKRQVSGLW